MKHLLIDYDGTLCDTDSVFAAKMDGLWGMPGRHLVELYNTIHREIVHDHRMDLHEDVEFHIATILKRIGQPVNAHTMEMVRCRFREAQEATFRLAAPYKDAIPFLERAQQAGFVLHLATGDHAPQKAQGVEKWGGRRYFTELFDNEIVGVNKGNAEYYRRALRTLGCSRDQALVIGDSPFNDIGPALELGLTAIWLNRDGKRFPLNGVRPDLEVATLLDVLTVL